jgi:hypothetical protein
LSYPHLEASPATTFHACSSPALTPVKPQHAPVILSQESVHTMLSITHHTRKRPSTGPRTTHGPQGQIWKSHIFSIRRMPSDLNFAYPRRKPCDSDACPPLQSFSAAATRAVKPPPRWLDRPNRSDRPSWAVEPAWVAAPPRRVFGLVFVAQPRNSVVFW